MSKTIKVELADIYSVNLYENGKFIEELCAREFYEDAVADARWYQDNNHPSAELVINDDSLGNRIYYIPEMGAFYKIILREDKFYIQATPALDDYLINFNRTNFTDIGYMGNEINGFDTIEGAEAFLQGMKFHATI